jgi:hypothetical protein
MSTNIIINGNENQVPDPPMWCCMPRLCGMIFSVLLLVSFGFLTLTISVEGITKGGDDDKWYEQQSLVEAAVIGYSVDIIVDVLAMIALCTRRFRHPAHALDHAQLDLLLPLLCHPHLPPRATVVLHGKDDARHLQK